jgi:hypothetical protein
VVDVYVKGWTAKEEVALYRRVKTEVAGKKMSLKQAVRNIHWWFPDRSFDSLYDKARKLLKGNPLPKQKPKSWEEIEEQLYKDIVNYMNKNGFNISEAARGISHKYPYREPKELAARFHQILYSNLENTSKKKLERYTIYKYLYPIRVEY